MSLSRPQSERLGRYGQRLLKIDAYNSFNSKSPYPYTLSLGHQRQTWISSKVTANVSMFDILESFVYSIESDCWSATSAMLRQ